MSKPPLTIYLASPRGFCAGVDRAIQIVEMAIRKYGPPVYVRHEIVHNKYVVDSLRAQGAVFVEELDEIPDDGQPVVFSAHGVPKSVPENAKARNMFYIDATCPLVTKVHNEALRHHKAGRQIILVGHAGHPEVIGTMGQLPEGAVILVETVGDVERIGLKKEEEGGKSEEGRGKREEGRAKREEGRAKMKDGRKKNEEQKESSFFHLPSSILDADNLAYCTQTTLSVEDTAAIVDALKKKFPAIIGSKKEDICYATTNRQAAVKAIAPKCEALIVIGSPSSSNSNRLVEVAATHGCPDVRLVERAAEMDWGWVAGKNTLGLTAGASAPEILVDEVIAAAKERFDVTIEEISITQEDVVFKVPAILNTLSLQGEGGTRAEGVGG